MVTVVMIACFSILVILFLAYIYVCVDCGYEQNNESNLENQVVTNHIHNRQCVAEI
mgnify:CR=1 FL=1|jgi:hypothetical protein